MTGDIYQVLRDEMKANADFLTAVGHRVYPQVAPLGTATPYVTMTLVSDVPYNSLDSTTRAERLSAQRVQIDVYAQTYEQARDVANHVEDALGGLARSDIKVELDESEHLYESDTKLHRISSDYTVHLQ